MQAKAFIKTLVSVYFIFGTVYGFAQKTDKDEILAILDRQTQAWNRADLEAFMIGYWPNEKLMYIGKSGIRYGYANTLASYQKNYGSVDKLGQLAFDIKEVVKISKKAYFVVGQFNLTQRPAGNLSGYFSLVFKKIKGEWVIVSDHSS